MTCPNCDFINAEEHIFCTACGIRIGEKQDAPCLVCLSGHSNNRYFLTGNRNRIGRDGANEIVLQDQQISKNHAAIVLSENRFLIEDLDSRNGVFVNGKRIDEATALISGSLVKLGTTILRFER